MEHRVGGAETRTERWPLLGAALLFAASLALFWPGYAMFDTVAQYGQVVSREWDDWHPPVMVGLWSWLRPIAPGAGAMLAVQLGGYWLGLGLIAAAVRGRAAVAVLGIGVLPPFLGWQGVVLKDAQMVGGLLGAVGLVAWWRLRGARVPVAAAVCAGVLIGYATLVRANAVFASVPLAVLLVGRPRRLGARVLAVVWGTAAVLALSPLINHQLLGAGHSGVERTQAIYDIAGIAVRTPGATDTGLTRDEAARVRAHRCVRAFFWDPLGTPSRCDGIVERLRTVPPASLYATLARAAFHHPLGYAAQRLAHLNSTERWWVPAYWPSAAPPLRSLPNDIGLGAPGREASWWQRLAAAAVETPLGWPFAWVTLAIGGLLVARAQPAGHRRDLALALLLSALTLEASFAVLSIASDLRYHLWPMIATALGCVLLVSEARPSRRALLPGAAALALVLGVGLIARLTLPTPPLNYEGMLG